MRPQSRARALTASCPTIDQEGARPQASAQRGRDRPQGRGRQVKIQRRSLEKTASSLAETAQDSTCLPQHLR
jgi:hypothetical protein